MNHYKIEIDGINGYPNSFMVVFDRKPLVHEAWGWLEKKLGERICYMIPNTLSVTPVTFETFEV